MQESLKIILTGKNTIATACGRLYSYTVILLVSILLSVECFSPAKARKSFDRSSTQPFVQANIASDPLLVSFGENNIRLVKELSSEYGIDYRMILAIMRNESRFDEAACSGRGAVGLMQLMPVTHEEIREELDLDEIGVASANIEAGIYYFSKLYSLFKDCPPEDRLKLSLAAYNAGPARVYDAQEILAYMGENPRRWSSIQHALPLLSKRYYSLHQAVWKNGKPKSGYFGSWKETQMYVANTYQTYKNYERTL